MRPTPVPAWLDDDTLAVPLAAVRSSEAFEAEGRVARRQLSCSAEWAMVEARIVEVAAIIAAAKRSKYQPQGAAR